MKLNEVAAPQLQKCGLIADIGDHKMDYDDFTGIGVFTSKTAFIAEIKSLYLENLDISDEQKALLAKAKNMKQLSELDEWDEFTNVVWIDDRF